MRGVMKPIKWSFSSLKTFQTCPRQYHHKYILKDLPDEPKAKHLIYGEQFHSAAEHYIQSDTPLPKQFMFAKGTLDFFKVKPGTKYCEHKMGLTANLDKCGFFDKDVWFRGIADLLIISEDGKKAYIIDYKTSATSKYADLGQLELMALTVFKHFPDVDKIKVGLVFVIANAFPNAEYSRSEFPELSLKWIEKYNLLESAAKHDVWNPNPSGLCREHCAVLSCPHNGRN